MTNQNLPPERAKKLYYEGVNKTCDAAITKTEKDGSVKILLIQRPDKTWSLPGGFVEKIQLEQGEYGDALTASKELAEETAFSVGGDKSILFSLKDRIGGKSFKVNDPLNNNERWIETSLFHKHYNKKESENLKIKDSTTRSENPEENETLKIEWVDIKDLSQYGFFADHKRLIGMVVDNLKTKEKELGIVRKVFSRIFK